MKTQRGFYVYEDGKAEAAIVRRDKLLAGISAAAEQVEKNFKDHCGESIWNRGACRDKLPGRLLCSFFFRKLAT